MSALLGHEITPEELEPTNAALVERAGHVTATDHVAASGWWASIARSVGEWWAEGHDLLLTPTVRSEEHTSELQSLMRISYAVFCLKKKNTRSHQDRYHR